MIQRSTLPRVLLLLAGFVFFSANTVHFVESSDSGLWASVDQTYHFDFDHAATKGLALNLKSALVVNYDNGEVLYARKPNQQRPIASITKLVSAMVVIDKGVSLDSTEIITGKDARRSSRSRLRVGYEVTLRDLLHAALMNSDNRAARALARATCGTIEEFVKDMNRKARTLGLKHTHFQEPTGLDSRNVSTAQEVAKILHYARDYDLIARITSEKQYRVEILNKKNVYVPMSNTNLLVHSRYDVLAGKTGYIRAADHCLATILRNSAGERLTVVVLGVPRDKLRFREARKLADWGFRRMAALAQL
ncbi:MAG TPA: serine hydrolase [Acidobacteriota bacterium]|nr:serine hydrolase [Acidobacteriota bacterium]